MALAFGLAAFAQEGRADRSSLPEPPTGYVNGLFTVNEGGTQVYFSQGNLQYADGQWRFAERQWDCLGDNGQGSADENVSRDLLGWGTSGQAHGAVSYQPWSVSQSADEYYAYGNAAYGLFDEDGTADWGANGIANGGGIAGLWRVLTREEWEWLLFERPTASGMRYAKAKVDGVCGVVLLPDDWSSDSYALANTDKVNGRYRDNVITASDWTASLEAHGAVLNTADASLAYRGRRIDLTKNEYRILETLLEKRGQIVSRSELMERLWETDSFVDENTLTVNIGRLRRKLEEHGLADFITTKKGLGYIIE